MSVRPVYSLETLQPSSFREHGVYCQDPLRNKQTGITDVKERKTQPALYQTEGSWGYTGPRSPSPREIPLLAPSPFLSAPLSLLLLLSSGFLHCLLTFYVLSRGPPWPCSSPAPATVYWTFPILPLQISKGWRAGWSRFSLFRKRFCSKPLLQSSH